jgi:glycosyltransferase involved in cell wall biosynthesis
MSCGPKISVIVPIYNVEAYLPRCIDSILSQTYRNIEVILVDDGSPDNSGKICDRYAGEDDRIKVIHRENGGLSAARNSGIDCATGEYLAFVDSDDYVKEDFIEFLYELMCKADADISACGALTVFSDGSTENPSTDTGTHIMDSREALERMCYNDSFYVTTWDKLYKRSLFDTVRFPEGKLFEDTGTTYLLVDRADTIITCGEPKYYYFRTPNSITTSQFTEKKLDYVEMADNMAEYIIKKYPDLRPAAERKQMHACFSTLTQLVNSDMRNKPVEKQLTARIKKLRKGAMKNPRTPKRDKAAILALSLGFGFFSFVWKLYRKQ